MWRNWSPYALLVGVFSAVATPGKVKLRTTISPSSSASAFIPQRIESRDSKRFLYTYVHSSMIHLAQ